MSSIVNKIKDKVSSSNSENQHNSSNNSGSNSEPTYSIQPVPNPSEHTGQLQGDPAAAHHAKGPHIPSREVRENLEKPLGREELNARQAELNPMDPPRN